MRPVVKPLLAVTVSLAGVTACSDDDPEAAEPPETTADIGDSEPAATAPRESDGVLRIGVLLPQTGVGAPLGGVGTTAATQAIAQINEAGGVFDEDVVLVRADEGDTPEQARAAVDALLDQNVDAIVGPGSSLVALEFLDDIVGAGVLTCSPTATSLALDDFPDDGLFFRTVPSDSLAAFALGFTAKRTGVSAATVVYADDTFGRPFARAVMANLAARGIDVLDEIPVQPGSTDYSAQAERLARTQPTGSIVVVADSATGWTFLTQLSDAMTQVSDGTPRPPRIIVNDALRSPPSPEIVAGLPEPFRNAIRGMSPLSFVGPGGGQPQGAYAPQAYNCVNLIALAAVAAGTDDPAAIARAIIPIADAGSDCADFASCADQLATGLDIDYQGPGQLLLQLSSSGDPSRAVFQTFKFGDNGLDEDDGPGTIGR